MNQRKGISQRFFWSWDHSTNWCMNTLGAQNCGLANKYTKDPQMFEIDYKRVIDWCADHKMTAVGIVGILRDTHGGVDSVRRLCEYGRKKGVLVYMIAGLFAYGGIYYEGKSKYSLNKFFEQNPECIAINADGSRVYNRHNVGKKGTELEYQGCASSEKLHDFVLESLDWVFKEIPELGGIQMESSDTGVCQCPKCLARRGEYDAKEPLSLADMAAIYPDASKVILARNPNALVICETYHHFLDPECKIFGAEKPSADLKKLLDMPKTTYWQWKCDKMIKEDTWERGVEMISTMQKFRHIMRSHAGTQWWGGRNTFEVDKIRRQCLLSYESGIDAVSMFGENSPYYANSEFNYLALEYFADNPYASMESFMQDIMAPRLGGVAKAETYNEIARLHLNLPKIPQATSEIAKIVAELKDTEAVRRWLNLGDFLNSYYWEKQQGGLLENMYANDADRPDEF